MYDPEIVVSIFLSTAKNLIIPFVSISPYTLMDGVAGTVVDPDIITLPDNVVLPYRLLFPVCVVEPVMLSEPVILSEPVNVNVFDPLSNVKLGEPLNALLALNCICVFEPPGDILFKA